MSYIYQFGVFRYRFLPAPDFHGLSMYYPSARRAHSAPNDVKTALTHAIFAINVRDDCDCPGDAIV